MKKVKKIAIIGCGFIGESILISLKKEKGFSNCVFVITRKSIKNGEPLAKKYNVIFEKNNKKAVIGADVVWLCVRPDIIGKVAKEIKLNLKDDAVVFSVAVAISKKYLSAILPNHAVIRYMPSPLFLSHKGVALICDNKSQYYNFWEKIIKKWSSKLVVVKDEEMHLFTTLASCSSAFYSIIVEKIIEVGYNLSNQKDEEIIKSILLTAGKDTVGYLENIGMTDIKNLVKNAATPGGMTEAGIKILNSKKARYILEETIKQTTLKSKLLQKKYET